MKERDALDFWREFSASSRWEDVWKPRTESLSGDDIVARWCYMDWLRGVHDRRLKVKWDHAYIEVLIRPDWLGDVVTFDSDSDDSNISSEGSETSETREKLAVAHQEFTELHKYCQRD